MISLSGARVLVAGMGKSGIASVALLREKGAQVSATDSKPLSELGDVADELNRWSIPFHQESEEPFSDYDLIVVSPGVPADLPGLERASAVAIPVVGEVELAGWFLQGETIGITGSNGKTTTTAMVGHILREAGFDCQVGGNIGVPVTAMVNGSRSGRWNVLELSSFQLETIQSFRAAIGVVVNVTPDHLDRHYTFENYAAAKGRLFANQTPEDFAVLNADDATCMAYSGQLASRPVWFSLARPVTPGIWLEEDRLMLDDQFVMKAGDIPLPGAHNVQNAMAAALACRLAGAEVSQIAAGIRSFPGVPHRLEFVREVDGVRYYNDSKATNVDATAKALDAFPGGLWIILGGKDKGSDYSVLAPALSQKARGVLLVGAAAQKIADHLGNAAPIFSCGSIEKAVEVGFREAKPGEIVLLAPACASFDQFRSYEHRGEVFKELVLGLPDPALAVKKGQGD